MSALGSITDPSLRGILQQLKGEIGYELNCHQVGTIVSFDATKQMASVSLTIKRVVFNQVQSIDAGLQVTPTLLDYPVLVDCPVFVLAGGGCHMTMPIAAGDPCLVLFGDRDIDNWLNAGTSQPPNTPRSHSLADGFALVGFRPVSKAFAGYSTTDSVWSLANGYVVLRAAGDVEIVSANGGDIRVQNQIRIANAATDLKTQMDALITALTSWVNTGGTTPNAGTIAALNAVKAGLDSLLES